MITVTVDADKLEHLLNCMDNQKYIHEQKPRTQIEWQRTIDAANREMRKIWLDQIREARLLCEQAENSTK